MRKDFTHHDKWFVALSSYDKRGHFEDGEQIIHVPPMLKMYKWHYHYIQKEDKLYRITPQDTETHRRNYGKYNKPHVAKRYMEEIPIDATWRQQIDEYVKQREEVRCARVSAEGV